MLGSDSEFTRTPVLSVEGLEVSFLETVVLRDLSFGCFAGELVVLTGPNGTGKTTVLNVISGLVGWQRGIIAVGEKRFSRKLWPWEAYRAGIRRTFQIPRLWESLSLLENIQLGAQVNAATGSEGLRRLLGGVDPSKSPTELSFGQRRMLELLRIHLDSANTSLVLLDEPLGGLDDHKTLAAKRIINSLLSEGCAVVLVDHQPTNWPGAKMIRLGGSNDLPE